MRWTAGAVRIARDVLRRMAQVELLDRVYVIAAGTFVSALPVLLLLTGVLGSSRRSESVFAAQLIGRLGLGGPAADAVRTLLPASRLRLYVVGLGISLFGLYSLTRRVARAYSAIWQIPDLPRSRWWRAGVWLLVELAAIVSVAVARDLARESTPVARVALFVLALIIWYAAELAGQRLITDGRVPWRALHLAAGLTAAGRLGVAIWAAVYLGTSMTRQAELYGPIGVVFALFTSLFASIAATLVATLIAATVTAKSAD
ncbi:hypothetical protein AB0M47_11485 [Hamadaea sp. NPDC051192]|uniref:hypothetical protein n=1 Tax=Hamadaea sp. NPDC051192 TaxID=3154940 RepID=UPI00343AE88D